MTSAARLRGQLGAMRRHHPDDIAAANDLRREHDLARLGEHVRRVIDARPPLTDDQRESLALLLRPAGPG